MLGSPARRRSPQSIHRSSTSTPKQPAAAAFRHRAGHHLPPPPRLASTAIGVYLTGGAYQVFAVMPQPTTNHSLPHPGSARSNVPAPDHRRHHIERIQKAARVNPQTCHVTVSFSFCGRLLWGSPSEHQFVGVGYDLAEWAVGKPSAWLIRLGTMFLPFSYLI
ncbi:hypothetical protein PAHAL_6G186100 [Panicum hallii]|uniref:Uncharacterized protein n=1 Tax=Panicum hallii TaxID=206008 RepID=A0A2T8IGQ7_9POAL|nr:hypothetical protein PAHAL_6G186100 [Panicum hallii]